ncbi:MAG: prepilin-type N-terminal cleavage/methylation domain-containing protein [Acholeplasmataceae bacterium]|jgi:type II secretion system protein G|nr:prepilin-type N-terminal cleavage/methylation domain-containing protein [Acholeplasmataceae bacterium]
MSVNYYKAFTLIELLVVIAIVGVLSTLSVISLNSARSKARDVKRLSDVRQIATALEMYFSDQAVYPTISWPSTMPLTGLCISDLGISSTCGAMVYLSKIPGDPRGDDYQYHQLANGNDYRLSFILEQEQSDYSAGQLAIGPNGIDNDLLLANGIDWRVTSNWFNTSGSSPCGLVWDEDLQALKAVGSKWCVHKISIPINTSLKYFLQADFMTKNETSPVKLFYFGSTDVSPGSRTYFVANSYGASSNVWKFFRNSSPRTGEGSGTYQWRVSQTSTKIYIVFNNSGSSDQEAYLKDLNFYTEK